MATLPSESVADPKIAYAPARLKEWEQLNGRIWIPLQKPAEKSRTTIAGASFQFQRYCWSSVFRSKLCCLIESSTKVNYLVHSSSLRPWSQCDWPPEQLAVMPTSPARFRKSRGTKKTGEFMSLHRFIYTFRLVACQFGKVYFEKPLCLLSDISPESVLHPAKQFIFLRIRKHVIFIYDEQSLLPMQAD